MTSWLTAIWKTKLFCRFNNYFRRFFFLCGNATNIWELVTFRFIQGLGGGALLVTAQTIITESYPIAKEGWHKPSTEWCDRTYASPTIEAILWIAFLGLIFFINIPLGIIATL
jgi:DHA2 family multidrug resistance protein